MLKILIIMPIIPIVINYVVREIFLTKLGKAVKDWIEGVPIALIFSIITMYISFYIILTMNFNNREIQYRDNLWVVGENLNITLGIEGVSMIVLLIVTLIMPIVIFLREKNNLENILLIMESILIMVFLSLDILIFFILFELIIIPMFLVILRYGGRINKIEASYRFIIYTIIGSLLMLLSIIILYIKYGTTNIEIINIKLVSDYYENNIKIYYILWALIFISFIIKIPMFPFHTWLPEAHTEAPTIGSIILAAILLKLGTFGIYRYNLFLFNINYIQSKVEEILITPINYFKPIIIILSIISILNSAILAIRMVDLKKIIAYSSIVHINISIFAFISNEMIGLIGAIYLMFTHAFISAGLFLLVGILYKRYHTRLIYYYRGLSLTMPLFSLFLFLLILGNVSLPITSAFIAELLLIISSVKYNIFLTIILLLSIFFNTAFNFWLLIRVLYSKPNFQINIPHNQPKILSGSISTASHTFNICDLSLNEFIALLPLLILTLYFGITTQPIVDLLTYPILNILS